MIYFFVKKNEGNDLRCLTPMWPKFRISVPRRQREWAARARATEVIGIGIPMHIDIKLCAILIRGG